ncbi:RHS repeat-associated core domain-containing protein [Stenotrophomonas maltophilia]|uniref:RHS repeat-associated core domain-containing protein n=1 Tax=Stenotrophomonas maltophilia TaxID=40324 RepID=A0AAJ2JBI1_STEMA|nr:RHS repeat-associated core domain-containing protein [Stenotrophomonas maltophilia]MDT3468536.1 RHS repeat-associated core domain-containing protein [Stenotrophomonas maltophilia]
MSIAAKHFDPQLGIDIHMYAVPPCPLPTPHIGLVLDPFDYIPFIGSTIKVNGVHRGTAGTGGLDIHIPLGVWGPPLAAPMGPQFDGEEIFMGSRTVSADGEPFSRLAMPVLDCNLAGMINPFRVKKPKKPLRAMSLPTGLNVAIPTSVTVGGPPTVSWTALAFRAAFAGLGKLRKSAFFRKKMDAFAKWRRGKWGHLPSGFLKCKVLRAEPVDIRDGSVVVSHQDFDIPGRLSFAWQRSYGSRRAGEPGLCGAGWQTPADIRLELLDDGSVWLSGPDQAAFFPELPPADGEAGAILDFVDGARLLRRRGQWLVRFKSGLKYVFGGELPAGVSALPNPQSWPIERIEDAHGNHWRFERRDGHLVRIVESGIGDLQGRFIEVEARHGRIDRMALHDPATGLVHPLVSYRYSGEGDLLAAVDALGAPRTFAYEQHRLVRHTDRVGLSFHYAFDAQGRVVHSWGDGGLYDYHFEYDALLRETRVTDSLGHLSVVKFDENQLPLCEIDPLDGVTLFEYDDFGRTVAVTDPEGLRTAFAYDAQGNLICLTRADGTSIQMEYDLDDHMVSLRTPDGVDWQQAYDGRGLLVSQTDPLGATTRFDYDAQGQLHAQTNARQAVTQLRYDRHGLVAAVIDALGHESRFEHDPLGNLLRQVDPLGQVSRYEYDAKGRLLGTIGPDGSGVRCEYDAEDQLVRYTDEVGAQTRLQYVGIGQIGKRLQADGHSVEYRYDTEEQLVAVINQRGETYQLVRDALGRIVEEVDYWGQSRRYSYDAAGRLTATLDPLGQRIAFATDKLGRITRKTLPDVRHPGQQVQEHFVYDVQGQIVELRNAARTVKRRYDPLGQLLEELQDGFRVGYAYDEVGNRVLRETSAGNCVAFGYDLRDQTVSVAINDESPISMERDALGRTTREQLSPHLQREFTYDSRNLLTSQSVLKDAAPLFETRYDYDRSGNLTKRSDSAQGVDEYRYDAIGRLLQHIDPKGRVERYFNDPAGDRLRTEVKQVQARKVVGGDDDDLTTWTREGTYQGVHYVFDRAGDLVRKGAPQGDAPDDLTLIWDANHRLAESRRNGQSTYYGYDPLGRRVFKRNPTQTTWFFWDGNALLGEVRQANEAEDAVPVWVGNVASLVEVKRRQRRLERLYEAIWEYVYHPGTYVPLALLDPTIAIKPGAVAATGEAKRMGVMLRTGMIANPVSGAVARPSEATVTNLTDGAKKPIAAESPVRLGLGMLGGTRLGSAEAPPHRVAQKGPTFNDEAMRIPDKVVEQVDTTKAAPIDSCMDSRDVLAAPRPRILHIINDVNDCPSRIMDRHGQTHWHATISPWGSLQQLHFTAVENNIRLQGQYFDAETGLSYNRNRYYDPTIGAFISLDPLGLVASINLQAYVSNPFSESDPLGLWGEPMNGASATISVGNVSRTATSSSAGHAEINGLNWFIDEGPGFDGKKVVISDVVGHFKSGEIPVGVCTGCRSNIFDLLIDGNASSVVIPKTVGNVFKGNIEIQSTEFERMSREIGSIYRGAGTNKQKSDRAWALLEGACRS